MRLFWTCALKPTITFYYVKRECNCIKTVNLHKVVLIICLWVDYKFTNLVWAEHHCMAKPTINAPQNLQNCFRNLKKLWRNDQNTIITLYFKCFSFLITQILNHRPYMQWIKSIGGSRQNKLFLFIFIYVIALFFLSKMGSYVTKLSKLLILWALKWRPYYQI